MNESRIEQGTSFAVNAIGSGNVFAAIIGLFEEHIGLLSFIAMLIFNGVNWHFKRRKDKREDDAAKRDKDRYELETSKEGKDGS